MAAHWDFQVSSSRAFGGTQNGQHRHALEKDLILFLRAFLEVCRSQNFVFLKISDPIDIPLKDTIHKI